MKYKDASLKNVDINIRDTIVKNSVKGIPVEDTESPLFTKGLFLFGLPGRGKTYIMHAIANTIRKCGREAEVDVWQEVLLDTKNSFSEKYNPIQKFRNKDYILLDDIGLEKDSDWSQEMLFMVINRAELNGTTLFVSTNLNIEEFTKKYGERIMSRIEGMCDFYELKGEDRRIS